MNEGLEGGWLEWTAHVELWDETFDEAGERRERVEDAADVVVAKASRLSSRAWSAVSGLWRRRKPKSRKPAAEAPALVEAAETAGAAAMKATESEAAPAYAKRLKQSVWDTSRVALEATGPPKFMPLFPVWESTSGR